MARYIDADETKSVIEANDWSNPVVPQVVQAIIDRISTADVVPRAEVDLLKMERDEYKKHVDEDIIYVHRIKSEVAREIFSEVDT